MGNSSKNVPHQWMLVSIFFIVCIACLLLAVVAVFISVHEARHETLHLTGPPLLTTEILKNEFDNLKDRTDNLQELITTLIALSSLYTVVLTITGYLNVQKIISEAQTSLDAAVTTQASLEKEYGSLTHISENLEN